MMVGRTPAQPNSDSIGPNDPATCGGARYHPPFGNPGRYRQSAALPNTQRATDSGDAFRIRPNPTAHLCHQPEQNFALVPEARVVEVLFDARRIVTPPVHGLEVRIPRRDLPHRYPPRGSSRRSAGCARQDVAPTTAVNPMPKSSIDNSPINVPPSMLPLMSTACGIPISSCSV